MNPENHSKVTASHLKRNAYLYVRQSTTRQMIENKESTQRQYALRDRAIALGWHANQIVVIDNDLGQSGASATARKGFQRLVADVGTDQAGIVMGLEVSRLARNSADWHRLLEICALTNTLILDEEGIYDPAHFNDRLLLGLKGTMSEAELFVLRARLRGGLLNKARRGELHFGLPVGFIYDERGQTLIDPDLQVQRSVKLFFDTFARTGALSATVKHFRREGILFPKRLSRGPNKGQLAWSTLSVGRAATLLHNPAYAGAYAYGRHRCRKHPDGHTRVEKLPQDQWAVLIQDAHPGYISWDDFKRFEAQLSSAAKAAPFTKRQAPREGPALLQGRILCGRCGARMAVLYNVRKGGERVPQYVCWGRGREFCDPQCQSITGTEIDQAVSELLLEAITPQAMALALSVQAELTARIEETDRLRRCHVERAQYEADQARCRYMQVDPNNRLVADTLEADWNLKLRAVKDAQDDYEQKQKAQPLVVDEAARKRLADLVTDFPAVWRSETTPQRERKRMLALLIEDITLTKGKQVTIGVRFRTGTTETLTIPRPLTQQEQRATRPEVKQQLDTLLDEYTTAQAAHMLNERGLLTGAGAPFDVTSIQWICYTTKIKRLKDRLLEAGMMTCPQLCEKLGVSRATLSRWRLQGRLKARICNNRGDWLYWPPDHDNLSDDSTLTAVSKTTARDAV